MSAEKISLPPPSDGREPSSQVVVRVKGLELLSLKGLDLVVRRGERVAVIGETGSGKSVLLRCVLGLEKPDRGEVGLLGRRVRGRVRMTPGLGVAPQQPGLVDAWSVAANLERAAVAPLSEWQMRQLLDSVGLDEIQNPGFADPRTLSGGQQKKRIALLGALHRGSGLVLLDEPTSGLDPATVEAVTRVVRSVVERDGHSLLLVSHDYREVFELCDRILVLSDGKLRELPGKPASPEEIRAFASSMPGATPFCTARWKPRALTAAGEFRSAHRRSAASEPGRLPDLGRGRRHELHRAAPDAAAYRGGPRAYPAGPLRSGLRGGLSHPRPFGGAGGRRRGCARGRISVVAEALARAMTSATVWSAAAVVAVDFCLSLILFTRRL